MKYPGVILIALSIWPITTSLSYVLAHGTNVFGEGIRSVMRNV